MITCCLKVQAFEIQLELLEVPTRDNFHSFPVFISEFLTENVRSIVSLLVVKIIKQLQSIGYCRIKTIVGFSFKTLPLISPNEYFNFFAERDLTGNYPFNDVQLEVIEGHQDCEIQERYWFKHDIWIYIEKLNSSSKICLLLLDLFNCSTSFNIPFKSMSLF